jgi:hypothetical protein
LPVLQNPSISLLGLSDSCSVSKKQQVPRRLVNYYLTRTYIEGANHTRSISTGINSLIGEACEVDKNCISLQMICRSNRNCECLEGHFPTEDGRNCIASELKGIMFSLDKELLCAVDGTACISQWPRGLTHELSSPAQTVGSWVLIPLQA